MPAAPPSTERRLAAILVALLALALAACDDGGGGDDPDTASCPEGQVFNPTLGRCIAQSNDATDGFFADTDAEPDTAPDTTGGDDTDPADAPQDTRADTANPQCDQDDDGHESEICGGPDCDDHNIFVSPTRGEICDELDNNCDERVNEGLDCTFYVHTPETLYRIDPFLIGDPIEIVDVPMLHDIDTHPDGTLYGVTPTHLYQFNAGQIVWSLVGAFPSAIEDANGLAIDPLGNAFVTSANQLYAIDLVNPANSRLLGDLGEDPAGVPWYSSGDAVINKADTLYMSAKKQGQPDTLVTVDQAFGTTTAVGSMGIAGVYGLTAAFGRLFGVTSSGHLIEIDRATGQARIIHRYEGLSFWGAASTPDR